MSPGGGPTPRPASPIVAWFKGAPSVRKGKSYSFTVTWADLSNGTLDRSALGDGDLTVSGPGGFSAVATLVGVKAKRKGSRLVARYRVAAPGGAFDPADNGTYTVRTAAGAVASAPASQARRRPRQSPSPAPAPVLASLPQDVGRFRVAAGARAKRSGVLD